MWLSLAQAPRGVLIHQQLVVVLSTSSLQMCFVWVLPGTVLEESLPFRPSFSWVAPQLICWPFLVIRVSVLLSRWKGVCN